MWLEDVIASSSSSDAEGVGSLQSERHVNRSKTLQDMAEKEWS